jgi:hypothetical protein
MYICKKHILMVRTIFTPDKQYIPLSIPAQYVGKQVEVLVFPLDAPFPGEALTTHLASEQALSTDWLTIEEDMAWNDL